MGLNGSLSHIVLPRIDISKVPTLDLSKYYTIKIYVGWRASLVDKKIFCIGNEEPLPIEIDKYPKGKLPYQMDGIFLNDIGGGYQFMPDDIYVPGYETIKYSERLNTMEKQFGIRIDVRETVDFTTLVGDIADFYKDGFHTMIRRIDSPYHVNIEKSEIDPDTFIFYNIYK